MGCDDVKKLYLCLTPGRHIYLKGIVWLSSGNGNCFTKDVMILTNLEESVVSPLSKKPCLDSKDLKELLAGHQYLLRQVAWACGKTLCGRALN